MPTEPGGGQIGFDLWPREHDLPPRWHEACAISTAEQLDALPPLSVVRSAVGEVVLEKIDTKVAALRRAWFFNGYEVQFTTRAKLRCHGARHAAS